MQENRGRRQYYYDSYADEAEEERIRAERRKRKRAEARRKRRRRVFINRCIFGSCCLLILISFGFLIKFAFSKIVSNKGKEKENVVVTEIQNEDITLDQDNDLVGSNDYDLYDLSNKESEIEASNNFESQIPNKTYEAHTTDSTITTGDDVISERSIMIDLSSGDIVMQKGYKDRISPASMTKVLTVLVACENLTEEQLSDTVTITQEITGYAYSKDCSCVGYANDDQAIVKDLLYGTVLPSGADAALGLANYIAGSHEAFVDMMNNRLDQLGLSSSTHFTNCIGLYDDNHYSTVYDMAMIMEAALDNDLAREVLSTKHYVTGPTLEHPEGIEMSNWFLRRIEDKDTGGDVICAKTGFVVQSKNCAVSFGKNNNGTEYVICTQGSTSSWRCIYDHVAMYKQFEGR